MIICKVAVITSQPSTFTATMASSIVDLSHKLEPDMQIYPGDSVFTCTPTLEIEDHGCNVHLMSIGSHTGSLCAQSRIVSRKLDEKITGTHVDAPYHFFADGKKIDEIPLSTFIGPALTIDLSFKTAREVITWADLSSYSSSMHQGIILLLYTNWSKYWKTPKYYDHPFLTRDAAEKIMATGIRVIGVDMLSPDETRLDGTMGELGFGAHQVILSAGGVIAENLTNLKEVISKGAAVSMIPLNIRGCDGSPVRAFATITS